jgi:hypothetical protein
MIPVQSGITARFMHGAFDSAVLTASRPLWHAFLHTAHDPKVIAKT